MSDGRSEGAGGVAARVWVERMVRVRRRRVEGRRKGRCIVRGRGGLDCRHYTCLRSVGCLSTIKVEREDRDDC